MARRIDFMPNDYCQDGCPLYEPETEAIECSTLGDAADGKKRLLTYLTCKNEGLCGQVATGRIRFAKQKEAVD